MNEKGTLMEAFEQLKQNTGITAAWILSPQTPHDHNANAALTMTIHGKKITMFVEVKRTVQPYQLNRFIEQAEKNHPLLVVAEQIYPGMKEKLRENGIGYLDAAGNVYLHVEDQLVWIEGQKPNNQKEMTTNRAFTRAGLQAVFYLLQHPDAINDPYRQLAERTGVALGSIGYIVDGLETAGYILQLDKKRKKLINRNDLLDRWIEDYRDTLRPTLYLGNFRLTNADTFHDLDGLIERTENTVWGAEPAAEILTNHLKPGILTAFTDLAKTTLMQKWKLIPDNKGNIQVYRKFWKDPEWDEQKIVPPLLVYADLTLTGDPRNIETGNLIYEQYLKKNELE